MEPPETKTQSQSQSQKDKNPKLKQTKKKSNLRGAIMLGIPLAPMNLKQNPPSCHLSLCHTKGVSIGEGRVWGHHCLGPKLPKAKTSKTHKTRTRRHPNNAGNLPGPGPIAPRDKISRSGEPLTPMCVCVCVFE